MRLLERYTQRFLAEDLELYFDDLVDATERIWDLLDNYKEVVEGLESTNEAYIAHRQNYRLQLLTVVSVILLPLTLIASIFGMNVAFPGEGSAEAFWIILGGHPHARRSACSAASSGSAGSSAAGRDRLTEEELEARWEAAPVVGLVISLQVVLGIVSRQKGWDLWGLPWWVWLVTVVPETILLVLLAWARARKRLEQAGHRRNVALALIATVSLTNALLLATLIGSILQGEETDGAQLLMKAAAVWVTNVVAFGLWYWGIDRGGPIVRKRENPPLPDFQFPQLDNPHFAPPDWQPQIPDYMFVSFTNSIAFSPTDTFPLTRRAKMLMMSESFISAVTVLLVASRAIGILG